MFGHRPSVADLPSSTAFSPLAVKWKVTSMLWEPIVRSLPKAWWEQWIESVAEKGEMSMCPTLLTGPQYPVGRLVVEEPP